MNFKVDDILVLTETNPQDPYRIEYAEGKKFKVLELLEDNQVRVINLQTEEIIDAHTGSWMLTNCEIYKEPAPKNWDFSKVNSLLEDL